MLLSNPTLRTTTLTEMDVLAYERIWLPTGMIAIAASLSPLMQQGNLIARKAHVGLNMGVMTLFLWQAVSGMEIVNKIWSNR